MRQDKTYDIFVEIMILSETFKVNFNVLVENECSKYGTLYIQALPTKISKSNYVRNINLILLSKIENWHSELLTPNECQQKMVWIQSISNYLGKEISDNTCKTIRNYQESGKDKVDYRRTQRAHSQHSQQNRCNKSLWNIRTMAKKKSQLQT